MDAIKIRTFSIYGEVSYAIIPVEQVRSLTPNPASEELAVVRTKCGDTYLGHYSMADMVKFLDWDITNSYSSCTPSTGMER